MEPWVSRAAEALVVVMREVVVVAEMAVKGHLARLPLETRSPVVCVPFESLEMLRPAFLRGL